MNESTRIWIEERLGQVQALGSPWMITLTLIYSAIFIMGVLGNMPIILVILRFKYMQSIANLYIFNLAITDIISLVIGMPLELYQLWHQYPWKLGSLVCQLKVLIPETSSYASILTLVTFTLDRYYAIFGSQKNPNTNLQMNLTSSNRFVRNIILIWILALLGGSPLALLTKVNYLVSNSGEVILDSAWCGLPFNNPDIIWETIFLSSAIIFFIIPLFLICLLYYFIAVAIQKSTRLDIFNNQDAYSLDQCSNRKIAQSRKMVIRLLAAIVIAFTICWTPFHAQRLLFLYFSIYSEWTNEKREINQILFLSAGVCYYLNSSINPIIYSVMSSRFRMALSLYINSSSVNKRFKMMNSGDKPNSDNSMMNNKQGKGHWNKL